MNPKKQLYLWKETNSCSNNNSYNAKLYDDNGNEIQSLMKYSEIDDFMKNVYTVCKENRHDSDLNYNDEFEVFNQGPEKILKNNNPESLDDIIAPLTEDEYTYVNSYLKNLTYSFKKCIHQVFRPDIKIHGDMKPDGLGDCRTCKPDPLNNSHCKGYRPITIKTFNVYEK